MKSYFTILLLLLSSTLLINQIHAGKNDKRKHSHRTKPYKTTKIIENKKEIARKILRQNYLMHLNKQNDIKLSQNLAQTIQNYTKKIQDAVWLEYTELMNAFADFNIPLVVEILGEEIFNRLTDARKELTQTHKDAREGNLKAQKILKLIVEIPPIMQQISATSSDAIQKEIQKLYILITKKINELSQQISNLSQQKSYEPIANFLEYVKNTLEQILIKPLNAENGIDQLCATLESIQI